VVLESRTTHFDLTLEMLPTEEGLIGALDYSTDLFDRTTVKRILGHYEALLNTLKDGPESRLLDLSLGEDRPDSTESISVHEKFEDELFKFGIFQ
ncbi:MAG: condensation domain-containing protein, partial [Blastocatellia bacterium]|nr:condensation domain-containing protein [Blastocatellia bacterium]